jgi:NAD(P)-dependent dehydrogenase (short-subunit alcohol dehydrogenase family)
MLAPFRYEALDSPPPDALRERVVLVTGAGQGLGRAAAKACAAHGARVVLLGRTVVKLEAVYDEIVDAGHCEPAIVPCDLLQADQPKLDALALSIRSEFGRLDGIFHGASQFVSTMPLELIDLPAWDKQARLNLTVPAALTKAAMPLMKRAPDACVLFLSETHALSPKAYWGGFASTKSALTHLAAVWAEEARDIHGVRFNVLLPGPVETPMRRKSHPAEANGTLRPPDSLGPAIVMALSGVPQRISGALISA